MKLAMSVGDNRHYRLAEIRGRHFVQTATRARLPESLALEALKDVSESAEKAIAEVEKELPGGFPMRIHEVITTGMRARLAAI